MWRRVQIMKLFLLSHVQIFSSVPCFQAFPLSDKLHLLGYNVLEACESLHTHRCHNLKSTLNLCSSRNVKDIILRPYITEKTIVLKIIYIILKNSVPTAQEILDKEIRLMLFNEIIADYFEKRQL